MPELRLLPTLDLPVAFLRFWPEGRPGAALLAALDDLPAIPGLSRLDGALLALRPTAGRGAVVDLAVRLAAALQRRAPGIPGGEGEESSGLLVFPGRVRVGDERVEVLADGFFDDLEQRPPRLPAGRVVVTGYAAAWLDGHWRSSGLETYEGPSGRRVALHVLEGTRSSPFPWHNRTVFGRSLEIERPDLEARLRALLGEPRGVVEGVLGGGKSRAVHRVLGERPAVWVDFARTLPGPPVLARRIVHGLAELVGDPALDSGVPGDGEIAGRLADAARRLGTPPVLVVEDPELAGERDARLLASLLEDPRGGDGFRLLRLRRGGSGEPGDVKVAPLGAEEARDYAGRLLAGLEMPDAVGERFVDAGAGHFLALEEGLLAMVQQGLLRRVYGSFFYAGGADGDYRPSPRLVRHVEAAVSALGESLPLRMLAAAEEPMSAEHLRGACADFGVELGEAWSEPWIDGGWLRPENDRLRFACPAHGLALGATLGRDGARSLRHALGGVLALGGAEWTAYRLMAGSLDALPSLLDTSRDHSESAPREELFNALWTEHREHRERAGDETTELEILWALLPLARRLGCLGRLQRELDRAVILARGHEQRYVALVALKAEHDQEQGKYRDAEAGLREALAASEGFDDKRRATLFLRLGALLHRQCRWNEARDLFRDLAGVVEKGGPTALGATCRFYLGNIALHQRRLDAAANHHRQALDYRRGHGLEKPAGASLCALGAVALARGDYPRALESFEQGLATLEAAGAAEWDVSYALLGGGRAKIRLGELSGGAGMLKKALEARRGRDDVVGEAYAHLELALAYLLLEHDERAEAEARRAHFLLSLAPEGAFLADAERLLGRIALRQGEHARAGEHFSRAVDLHRRHSGELAVAEDRSWQLELARARGEVREVEGAVLALERLLEGLPESAAGEAVSLRLFLGLTWLREHGLDLGDPERPLRRAYKELMRKTGFLPPETRQGFLFQVRVHQEILDHATRYQISLPYVPQVMPPRAT